MLRALVGWGAAAGLGTLGCSSAGGETGDAGGRSGPDAGAVPDAASVLDAGADAGTDAAAAVPDAAGRPRQRVAIIGSGTAGVTLAWLLDGEADVVLFEANETLGGNVRTIETTVGDTPYTIDLGAQYFHPRTHETFAGLLQHMGLFDPAGGAAAEALGAFEYPSTLTIFGVGEENPRFVSPARPSRLWPISAPWNTDGIAAFAALATAGARMEADDAPWDVTVETFLAGLSITDAQRSQILLPLAATVNNSDIEVARTLSARSAFTFISRNVRPNPLDPVTNFVLRPGLGELHRRLVADCATLTVRTGVRVAAVVSNPDRRLTLATADGPVDAGGPFDAVVLAGAPLDAGAMLGQVAGAEAVIAAFGDIETYPTRIALHRDPIYAPTDPRNWSLVNARADGGFCETSMYLGAALPTLPDGTAPSLWKSWVTHRNEPPADSVLETEFRHLLTTPRTLGAGQRLQALQGTAGLSFVGTYLHPVDSQDTAVESALTVATRLAAQSAHLAALGPV